MTKELIELDAKLAFKLYIQNYSGRGHSTKLRLAWFNPEKKKL
jgi:hypothetical protein